MHTKVRKLVRVIVAMFNGFVSGVAQFKVIAQGLVRMDM